MSLPFCPNCRNLLPAPVASWICLRVPPREPAASPAESQGTIGNVKFEKSETRQVLYEEEGKVCEHFNATGGKCTQCEGLKDDEHFLVACPVCQVELPDLEGIESRSLTLTGPSGAGKTSYILALDNWWNKHLYHFRLTVRPVMGQRRRDDFIHLKNTIFRHRRTVEATPRGSLISFTWCIRDRDGGADGCLVTFPDVSGESLKSARSLVANRHYDYSAGIIFLLDAERMLPQDTEGGNPRDPHEHYDVAEAMIRDLERRHKGVKRQDMANIPVAVCVNKIDLLMTQSEDWHSLLTEYSPKHKGYFDWAVCEERSGQIRDQLYRNEATAPTLGLLESVFHQIMFFAVATLGSDGDQDLAVNPIGVEDPLLYLLYHLGYLEANSAS